MLGLLKINKKQVKKSFFNASVSSVIKCFLCKFKHIVLLTKLKSKHVITLSTKVVNYYLQIYFSSGQKQNNIYENNF